MRRISFILTFAAFCLAALLAWLPVSIHAAEGPALAMREDVLRAMRDDASLCDVAFVDQQHGWAVGDRGTIWNTRDGGARWELQESGVYCRLTVVQFVDAQHGWAAGGETEPFSHVSRGVLLRTRDGGRTWTELPQQLMGNVLRLKFIDARRGWALCVPNGLCPGGVLRTEDGGRDWTPVPQQTLHPWSCGDVVDFARGAFATDGGNAAAVARGEFRPTHFESDLRRPAAMRLLESGHGFLIGEGSLLLTTRDAGGHWEAASASLPAEAADVNFSAIALKDNQIWLAGTPGLQVLHSADNGTTWQAHPTGSTLPIAALNFVDAEHGWAVGALGQILATADGGRTWKPQRGAGRRAAYLAVFGETSDVPLEVLTRLSAGEGYRGVVSLIARRDLESPTEPPPLSRLRQQEALLLAGAGEVSVAWQFPLRQQGIARPAAGIIEDWQRTVGDADTLARLEAYLVRELRCWRPEIVLTEADAGESAPLAKIVSAALLRAVKRAGDENDTSGLQPWKVKRVLTSLTAHRRGALTVAGSQILPQLGRSLMETAAPARGVLSSYAESALDGVPFVIAWDEAPHGEAVRDFFSGLPLRAPSDARRTPLAEAPASIEEMRLIAQRRQLLQAIVTRQAPASGNRAAWLAQVGTLTRDLDEASAALLLYQLGCRYRSAGQSDLAAETFMQLAEKYPSQSGLAAASSLWLVQYYGSGELTVRADREGRLPVQLARSDQPVAAGRSRGRASLIPATDEPAPRTEEPASSPAEEKAAPADEAAGGSAAVGTGVARRKLGAEWAQRLQSISNQLAAEPRSALPASRALNISETDDQSQRLMLGLMRSRAGDTWWACAAAEQWLSGARAQRAQAPKPVYLCRRTDQKPRLDGKLDDACWRRADGAELPRMELHSALDEDGAWPAVVQFAYDQEFLYVAATCHRAPGAQYAAAAEPRQRDADLARHDRIAVMLDIDRDWTSYWRLAVDHRGWTADDCWGDRTWNPKWFVAAAQQETTWTCEAAIPWSELAPRPPQKGDAWSAGVERTVPGVGFQSWTTPAAAATVRPEGFGLLIFN